MANFRCVILVLIQLTRVVISCEFQSSQDKNNSMFSSFNLTNNSCINVLQSSGKIKNNTEIVFFSNVSFYITKDLSFNKLAGLILIGSSGVAKVNCTAKTGISFTDITNLHLEQLHISGCGNEHQNGGVTITNCTHVTITRVTIERSWRTGLALLNTGGVVVIQNCSFLANGFNLDNFDQKGGGTQVVLPNGETSITYLITNCQFWNNTATDGGGLFLLINIGTKQNITINDTVFQHNKCENSGGGLKIEHTAMTKASNCSISLKNCIFSNNIALFGGGTSLISSPSILNFSHFRITFSECRFDSNSARFGMAVDISIVLGKKLVGDFFPSLVFLNCHFVHNKNSYLSDDVSVLSSNEFRVEFGGTTTFERNSGSSIVATTSTLAFHEQSSVSFQNNYGIRGAAIKIDDSSVIEFCDNSKFQFQKNTASTRGGAIYVQYMDKRVFYLQYEKCFLQYYRGEKKVPKNVTFKFEGNNAGSEANNVINNQGDSLFVPFVTACIEKYILPFINKSLSLSEEKKHLGDFVFDVGSSKRNQISTVASYFVPSSLNKGCQKISGSIEDFILVDKMDTMHFIPGKPKDLPLKLMNDLKQEMPFEVSATITSKNSNVFLNPTHTHSVLTSNQLTLFGKPKEVACIQLSTLEAQKINLVFKVSMDECPPGYVYSNMLYKCVCSDKNKYFKKIEVCNDTVFQASIQYAFWIGHESKSKESNLATAICPRGYCTRYRHMQRYTYLPLNASDDISKNVCEKGRKGIVCGSCRNNLSVYYNSESFHCGSNDLCHLGWLFYILSELVPVTILFLIIILFNISFTSGPLNGVIFFMQMISTLKIQADNFIWYEPGVHEIKQIHQFVYSIFNLDFFKITANNLSFCLWEGATALDLLAFRYVTILYSLILVVITVVLMRQCNSYCNFFCERSSPTFKGSVIHGLSAFLVMSYSSCTRVSLLILTPVTLHIGPNYENNPRFKLVPHYKGDYSYMGSEHLRYAIPAIFFILTVTIIPPLLLLSYPLCYKLFALLRIDESKFVQIACKIFPLEKIKPFFDSMQGAFKDRYRFFAGLYFVYRLVCLLSFALADTFTIHYMLTGGFLALMLAIHGALRPYKKGWQNLLEAFLLLNLSVANALTFYNYYVAIHKQNKTYLVAITAIQNVLILLPLLYLVCYIVYCLFEKLHSLCRHHQLSQKENEDFDAILDVLDRRDPEYKLMQLP